MPCLSHPLRSAASVENRVAPPMLVTGGESALEEKIPSTSPDGRRDAEDLAIARSSASSTATLVVTGAGEVGSPVCPPRNPRWYSLGPCVGTPRTSALSTNGACAERDLPVVVRRGEEAGVDHCAPEPSWPSGRHGGRSTSTLVGRE